MSLGVTQIMDMMEQYAPEELKESYDNVGLLIGDKECEITNILVTLDCTLKVIDEAIEKGCNLIVTHHPIIFKKPSNITKDTLLGKKIIKLIKNDINVFASHTNLDSTSQGINEIIMEKLNFCRSEILEVSSVSSSAGLGRIITLEKEMSLAELIDLIKDKLNIDKLRFCGEEEQVLKRVALINGSGQDYISEAIKKGADCIITGDTTYHYVSDCNEENISVIDAGHFGTEWPAMKIIAELIEDKIKALGCNNSVILSEHNVSPYKFK